LQLTGIINPGGETETAINSSLYRLSTPLAEDGDDEGRDGDNGEETPPPPPPEDDGDEGDSNDDGGDDEEEAPEEPD
tara:strand:- start:5150 stop:5380 length:231 start_codon:yes stop_codon:yes gene_type:complete